MHTNSETATLAALADGGVIWHQPFHPQCGADLSYNCRLITGS
jgi:hypothetical protein